MKTNDNSDSYILSIVHGCENDDLRSLTNQVGLSILMWNFNLVQRCLRRPDNWCDTTFSFVSSHPTEVVKYELNTMVTKYIELVRVFHLYCQNSFSKTNRARMNMFDVFLKVLRAKRPQDPLAMPVHEIMSLCTDVETTYAVAFGRSIAEIVHQRKCLWAFQHKYVLPWL